MSWFAWIVESSGFIGLVILLLSIYFVSTVAQIVFRVADLRWPCRRRSSAAAKNCSSSAISRAVFDIVRATIRFSAGLLTTGISELPNGLAEARESMERVGDSMTVEMEKKISMLAVLGTLGPMIGLVGHAHGNDRKLQRHRPSATCN